MNILYYCAEYPPATTGGIGSVTKIMAEELVKQGHHIYIIGLYPATENHLPQHSIINGVHVFRYFEKKESWGTGFIGQKLTTFVRRLGLRNKRNQDECNFIENKINKLIKDFHIDILELTDYYSFIAKATVLLSFQKFSIPTVVRLHGSVSFLKYNKHQLKGKAYINDARHIGRADAVCAVSQTVANYVTQHLNIATNKITVIPNALEDAFYAPATYHSNAKKKYILFIGKIKASKGAFSTIESFLQIADKYPKIHLKLIGGGDIKKAKQQVPPQLIDKITFTGYLNRKQIIKEIDSCLFACVPSHFETFGMVAIEIMARKKAIIYTNTTAGKEIIEDGVNGLLVSPFDTTAIKNKMIYLLQHQNERERIEINAYHSVFKYNIKNISQRMIDFYKNLVENI